MANAQTNNSRDIIFDLIEQRGLIGGRFATPRRLGTGTFSLVLKAQDSQTGQQIALKVFDPFIRDLYRQEAFRREAEILERLRGQRDIIELVSPIAVHNDSLPVKLPNGQISNYPIDLTYFALELAAEDGLSWLTSKQRSPRDLLLAFRAMCRAVQRLHHNRLAHRDLKLDNFLISKSGEPRLADFGTVRDVDKPGLAPAYSGPPGDLRFSAPEMLALLPDADAAIAMRSDFYSLGCILYQLFTGIILGPLLFDQMLVDDLIQVMAATQPSQRKGIFDNSVSVLRNARPLPSLGLANRVPGSILPLADELYKRLADIDYRRRLCDFDMIFLRLNVLLEILEHEAQFQKWRKQRARRSGKP